MTEMDIQVWIVLEILQADKPVLWKLDLQVKCRHSANGTELKPVCGQAVKKSAVKGEYTIWHKYNWSGSHISSSVH